MKPLVVLNVVGLTPKLLAYAPNIARIGKDGFSAPISTVLPAVTCSVQSTILTGTLPREHGVVGNGWYFRDLSEVWLWRQSNRLVAGEKLWEALKRRDPSAACANLFWWYNMYSTADWSVTPRPAYFADGRKEPDIYTEPADLRRELQAELGAFPLFEFWGPRAGIRSSEWIAEAAARTFDRRRPALTLVYLPHLDYPLQRVGPDHLSIPAEVGAIDRVAGKLIDHVRAKGAEVVVLSEYGVTAVAGPVHLNRALREAGFLRVRDDQVGEILDAGASRAFAVADHQVAHVYVRDLADVPAVRKLLEAVSGVERVLDEAGKREAGLDHPRAGELVAVAKPDRWFTYYYWLEDRRAPDFARTVDIHKKPGYDPAELFLDPVIPAAKLKVAWTLLRKKLGFRYLMNVIPLDATLVKGSHGRLPARPEDGPIFLSTSKAGAGERVDILSVKRILLDTIGAS